MSNQVSAVGYQVEAMRPLPRMWAQMRQMIRQDRAGWLLLGCWALGMMSLPIGLWLMGEAILPVGMTVTTVLQAGAVIMLLRRAWGWRRVGLTLAGVAALGWLVEFIGSSTGLPFGVYHYTERLQPQLGGVPLLIPLAWFMMLPPAWTVATLIGGRGGRWRFLLLSMLAFTAWDLFLDPQMVLFDFWRWETAGGYFGIPWSNYAGWLLAAGVMTLVVRPPMQPVRPLLLVYGLVWFFETFGLLFFWELPGPALVGGLVMGAFTLVAFLRARTAAGERGAA